MPPETTDKPIKSVKLASKFTMGELDFRRMDSICYIIDEQSIEVQGGRTKYIPTYLSSLGALYNYMRPLLLPDAIKTLDKRFKDLRDKVFGAFSDKDLEALRVLHQDMYGWRQILNLGMAVEKPRGEGILKKLKAVGMYV